MTMCYIHNHKEMHALWRTVHPAEIPPMPAAGRKEARVMITIIYPIQKAASHRCKDNVSELKWIPAHAWELALMLALW